MGNPFLRAKRRAIRRVGKHNKVTVVTELGEEFEISAVFVNPAEVAKLIKQGTTKGGRDFRQSAKTLRVLDEETEGVNPEWRITVNGTEYFPADNLPDGNGSTLLFLAPSSAPSGGDDDWQ